MVLSKEKIIADGIVTGLIDSTIQMQPAGIDLTVKEINMYMSAGTIDFDNSNRTKPRLAIFNPVEGNWDLSPGAYLVTVNETTTIPTNCFGIARPRSSLLRMGATVNTALWDPGYSGKPQVMLVIHNQHGLQLQKNARILQLIILPLGQEATAYAGIYQKEGLSA